MKNLFLLCLLVSAAVCFAAQDAKQPETATKAIGVEQIRAADHIGSDRYALVIGIDDYQDGLVPDLKTCQADAEAVYALLTDPAKGGIDKKNAYLLLGQEATARNIGIHLGKLRKIPSKSTVFVYFSGHGSKEGEEAYWVAQDSRIEDLFATGISNMEVQRYLSSIPSDRVVVMLDCCYAAATVKGGKSAIGDFDTVLKQFTGKGRAYLMAAGSGEEAIEAKDLKSSVFTYYLVEGMNGKADKNADGVIVLTELTGYIDEKVADEARVRGGIQRPVVKMEEVSEPSKFGLTIDAARIRRNLQETEQEKQLRQQRLAKLRQFYLDEKIGIDLYQLCTNLLETSRDKLDDTDIKKLKEVLAVADGTLEPDKLQRALDAIETPSQRQARLDRESAELAARQRQQKITELLQTAKSKDNKEQGKEALRALDELLTLESSHFEALQLKKKISGYYVQPFEVRENTLGMKLVYLPAGEFMMGDTLSPEEVHRKWPGGQLEWYKWSHPRHQVKLTEGFFMSSTEVTRGQFAQFVRETDHKTDAEKQGNARAFKDGSFKEVSGVYWRNPLFDQTDSHPVVCVSYNDATAFCEWLSKKESRTYQLPTEAQWEYACRGGKDTTTWYWGDDESGAQGKANVTSEGEELNWTYKFKGVRDGYTYTAPVASFDANPYGLYDTIGNVWEWCSDWFQESYAGLPSVDPQGPSSGSCRVLRGGSWYGDPRLCRAAFRGWDSPDLRITVYGFRVVCLDFQ